MESYLSKVNKLRQSVSERVEAGGNNDDEMQSPSESGDADTESESIKRRHAISKLQGRDRVGVLGEAAVVAGGTAAGAALSGVAAGAAGASTLLGSTSLAGLLGGVFVTATPIGWVIGSAAVAGVAGYGLVKLIRSGNTQDHVRSQACQRLTAQEAGARAIARQASEGDDLESLLRLVLEAGAIPLESANKMTSYLQTGKLSPELALQRIKDIALKHGLIGQD